MKHPYDSNIIKDNSIIGNFKNSIEEIVKFKSDNKLLVKRLVVLRDIYGTHYEIRGIDMKLHQLKDELSNIECWKKIDVI